jgi:hypothetical protein
MASVSRWWRRPATDGAALAGAAGADRAGLHGGSRRRVVHQGPATTDRGVAGDSTSAETPEWMAWPTRRGSGHRGVSTDELLEAAVIRVLNEKGLGRDTRWSTPSTAGWMDRVFAVVGVADLAGVRLKPHVAETWKPSTEPGVPCEGPRRPRRPGHEPARACPSLGGERRSHNPALHRIGPCLPVLSANQARMTCDLRRERHD